MQPGSTVNHFFTVGTYAPINADELPTVTVIRNGLVTSITPVVTNLGVGEYQANFGIPEDWEHGEPVALRIVATVNGESGKAFKHLGNVHVDVEHRVL